MTVDLDAIFDAGYLADFLVTNLGFAPLSLIRLLESRPDLVELLKTEVAQLPPPTEEQVNDNEVEVDSEEE